jgi:hypothetical protein
MHLPFIDLPTLLGLAEHPGEIPGYGIIPAGLARELAADGTWRRLVTDPQTGHLIDCGRTRYRPTQQLTTTSSPANASPRSPAPPSPPCAATSATPRHTRTVGPTGTTSDPSTDAPTAPKPSATGKPDEPPTAPPTGPAPPATPTRTDPTTTASGHKPSFLGSGPITRDGKLAPPNAAHRSVRCRRHRAAAMCRPRSASAGATRPPNPPPR